MANLHSFFIIFTLTLILSNICHVHSQTTTSATKTPTNEPTVDPTLEPTLNPLFVLISSTNIPTTSYINSSPSNITFFEENYLWLIIGASALICICLIIVVFVIRNKTHSKLNSELKNTNETIHNEKEEQQPMNISSISPSDTTITNQAIYTNHYNNINIYGTYQQQFNMQQMQQLQQTAMMQQYQQNTNFQTPQSIAAYQALEFCPPINHDGNTWKSLSHLNPQQRMLQLMHQQQYIQQMANQAAIAMAFFLDKQQQIHAQHVQHNNNNNNNNNNQHVQHNNKLMDPMRLQPKKQRLDTMDTAALASDDLPPSMEQNNDIMFANEPGSNLNLGGDKIFYQDAVGVSNEEHVMHIQINDEKNNELIMVPPPNPMEISNLNVPAANMGKVVGSLSSNIPDLPFFNSEEEIYNEYNEEYEQYRQ